MKCTRCGFHNLPGLEECGGCGVALTARLTPAEVYPLRAHERTRSDRLREAYGNRHGRLQEQLRQLRTRLQPLDAGVSLGCFVRSLPGVVPGLRQFRTRGRRVGGAMLGSAALLLGSVPLTLRHPFSNFALWTLALLSMASFSDAWLSEEARLPRSQPAWQWVVIPLYVLSLYLGAYSLAGMLLGRSYPTYRIGLTMNETVTRGDIFLVKRLDPRNATGSHALRQGALVAFRRGGAAPGIGRVAAIGVPYVPVGDAELGGAKPLTDQQTAERGILIDDLTYERRTEVAPPEQRVYPRDEVIGTVLARINPPRRRAWLAGR